MGLPERSKIIRGLRNGLLVSCQVPDGSPLGHSRIIASLAKVAEQEGAVGVRVNGVRNIRAVCHAVKVPVVGIEKLHHDGFPVYITPTLASASRVCRAGAHIIAMDCTQRPRPGKEPVERIVQELKRKFDTILMADVSTLEEGLAAAELGADLVATTLHGYTGDAPSVTKPAFALLRQLGEKLKIPVILEGRVRNPEDVRRAFDLGAYAVVVGTAITNVEWLVRKFVEATPAAARPT